MMGKKSRVGYLLPSSTKNHDSISYRWFLKTFRKRLRKNGNKRSGKQSQGFLRDWRLFLKKYCKKAICRGCPKSHLHKILISRR